MVLQQHLLTDFTFPARGANYNTKLPSTVDVIVSLLPTLIQLEEQVYHDSQQYCALRDSCG
jgi:hypothetical protein